MCVADLVVSVENLWQATVAYADQSFKIESILTAGKDRADYQPLSLEMSPYKKSKISCQECAFHVKISTTIEPEYLESFDNIKELSYELHY